MVCSVYSGTTGGARNFFVEVQRIPQKSYKFHLNQFFSITWMQNVAPICMYVFIYEKL